MNIRIVIVILLIGLCIACKEKELDKYAQVRAEISTLKTNDQRQEYLEKIFLEDQSVRGPEGQEIMLKYGKDSPEHQAYIDQMWEMDLLNLYKVEKYLASYGYPSLEQYGDKANTAPWMVIHHQEELSPRDRNFENIYGAYLNKYLDDGALTFYLNRWYQFVHGERLKMKSPFRAEDEIRA